MHLDLEQLLAKMTPHSLELIFYFFRLISSVDKKSAMNKFFHDQMVMINFPRPVYYKINIFPYYLLLIGLILTQAHPGQFTGHTHSWLV